MTTSPHEKIEVCEHNILIMTYKFKWSAKIPQETMTRATNSHIQLIDSISNMRMYAWERVTLKIKTIHKN